MTNKNGSKPQGNGDTSAQESIDTVQSLKSDTEDTSTKNNGVDKPVAKTTDKASNDKPEMDNATGSVPVKSVSEDSVAEDNPAKTPVKSNRRNEQDIKAPDHSKEIKDADRKVSKLAIFCLFLIIVIAVSGGVATNYFYQQVNNEQDTISQLTANHQADINAAKREMTQQLAHQTEQLKQQLNSQLVEQQRLMSAMEQKMAELAGRRPNDWLLAEANYLVKLAGRKLWQEKNIETARSLLVTADLRISEMNEPALIDIRQALASDIASLQALPVDNSETLALKLDGLLSQVDNLKLNMIELPEVATGQDTESLSDSTDDWLENLKRTWHSFSDSVITVRRRSGSVEPLMSPKQQWYLEENLKRKLMQTQLAVYRQQQTAYQHAIELSSRWILQFYDREDATTKFMLNELRNLKKEQVSVNYPQKFSSSYLIIDELLQRNIGHNQTVVR